MKCVVSPGIGGKPIFAIDLLPPGGKSWKQILVAPLFANIRDSFAKRLHDLEIVIVHPDTPLKISFLANDLLRCNVEDVTMQLLFLLLADIEDVVFGNFIRGQDEGEPMTRVVA